MFAQLRANHLKPRSPKCISGAASSFNTGSRRDLVAMLSLLSYYLSMNKFECGARQQQPHSWANRTTQYRAARQKEHRSRRFYFPAPVGVTNGIRNVRSICCRCWACAQTFRAPLNKSGKEGIWNRRVSKVAPPRAIPELRAVCARGCESLIAERCLTAQRTTDEISGADTQPKLFV